MNLNTALNKLKLAPIAIIPLLTLHWWSDENYLSDTTYFVLFASLLIAIWAFVSLFRRKLCVLKYGLHDIILPLLLLYLILNTALVSGFGWEYILYRVLLCVGMFYIFIKQYITSGNRENLVIIILLLGLGECVLGLSNMEGVIFSQANAFLIKGSFDNPGLFGNYIAIVMPIAMSAVLFWEKVGKTTFVLATLFILVGAITLSFLLARAAWVGILAGMATVIAMKLKERISLRKVLMIAPVLVGFAILGGYYIYKLKPESANGRALIYKVMCDKIPDNLLVGSGLGRFPVEYNIAQADYLREKEVSEQIKMLASNNNVGFNEYLQLLFDTGIIGLLLCLSLLIAILYRRKSINSVYGIGGFGAIISLAVCSLFSYPTHNITIIIISLICVRLIGFDLDKCTFRIRKSGPLALALSGVLIAGYSINEMRYLQKWERCVSATEVIGFEKTKNIYLDLDTSLGHNPYFLFNYGIELTVNGEYAQGVEKLEEAKRYFIDTDLLCSLGDAYKGVGEYDVAEYNYILASEIVPSKFYPLYCLVNMLNETGQTERTYSLCSAILDKKEKVYSMSVAKIKSEVRQIRDSLDNMERVKILKKD